MLEIFDKFRHKKPTGMDWVSSEVDTDQLDGSMQLLRITTLEVSQAAVNAARSLQTQLVDTEHRFASTINTIDDLVIIKDGWGHWNIVNKVGQDLFGWLDHEYLGRTNSQLASTFPEHRDCLGEFDIGDNIAWESRKSYRKMISIPTADGLQCFDTIKTPVFNEDGSRKELIVVGRNSTELTEVQKRMKACFMALNSISDMVVILDKHAQIVFCNDKFIKAYCPDCGENIIGDTFRDAVDLEPSYDEMWETVSSNRIWEGIIHDARNTTHYRISVVPMMNGAPHPIYYICTMKTSAIVQTKE